jgi:hypothetical protein
MSNTKLTKEEALAIGEDAYVFGYPLVLMDVTRRTMTAVSKVEERKAPINHFVHFKQFPDPASTDVVSPNADTLYSSAWIDLIKEPIILSVPAMGNRYYLMQMLDAWTNVFASPGTRTMGNGKGDFAIVGPFWKGQLPQGFKEIKSPTNTIWLVGRTQTNGKNDFAAVHAIQKQYTLTPLSAWGKSYIAPDIVPVEAGVDTKTPPVEQVARMDAPTFFSRMNAAMKNNPPASADAAAMKRFAAIGITPGKPFNLREYDLAAAEGLEQSVKAGQAKIAAEAQKSLGKKVNGWDVMTNLGRYGTNYLFRAVVAQVELGVNLPEDAIYPRATVDIDGKPLVGTNRYVVQFPKGQLPPVGAFWSITMYNTKQFFVPNPIDRYAIGDRDNLKSNDDGSVTIYIQHESPGPDKESNWLPAPKDEFTLFMRLYFPRKEIMDGTWKMPPVTREGARPKTEAA